MQNATVISLYDVNIIINNCLLTLTLIPNANVGIHDAISTIAVNDANDANAARC